MTQPKSGAFPVDAGEMGLNGLTKREYFAAMAMQGLIAANKLIEYGDHGFKREMNFGETAQAARIHADFLIRELNQQP